MRVAFRLTTTFITSHQTNSTLRPHLLALVKAAFRRKITDLDFSHCGGDKAAVTAMVEEAKRSIPTLGLPQGQPVKVTA